MHLIFWDLGGQAGLRSIWDKYYAETNALIYLIDSSAHRWMAIACAFHLARLIRPPVCLLVCSACWRFLPDLQLRPSQTLVGCS